MVQLYTASFLYVFLIHIKWQSIILDCIKIPNTFLILMAQMIFSQIQQAPGPDSRKVEKSLLFDRQMSRRIDGLWD